MKNKSLNKLIRKITWKNKGKIFIIALVLSIAISIFVSFGFANAFLQHNVDVLKSKYKSFDFSVSKDKSLKQSKLNDLAKKYNFTYENKDVKVVDQRLNIKGKTPIVHYDNNNTFGVKYLISSDQIKDNISRPFIINGRFIKNSGEVVVLPQLLKVGNLKIGSYLNLPNKKLKIVGTYSTPQYQKNIQTSLTDKNIYVIPIQVSKSDFDAINGNIKSYIYGVFNNKMDYASRISMYKKMNQDQLVLKNIRLPKYEHIKKSLTYNKNKVCVSNEQIKQYENNSDLSIVQFNKISAMIMQAQNGGQCRSSITDIKLGKNANDINFTQSLNQGQSTNFNTSSTDLTPHYKTPQLISYNSEPYQMSNQIKDMAVSLANQISNDVEQIVGGVKQLNFTGGIAPSIVKYLHSENILADAQNGVSGFKLKLEFKDPKGSSTYINAITKKVENYDDTWLVKISNATKQPTDIPSYSFAPITNAIAKDKATYNAEQLSKKSQIDAKNAKIKQDVELWNKNEDERVASLKKAKAQGEANLKKAQADAKAKLELQKKKAEEQNKKLGIVTSKFNIKIQKGYISRYVHMFDSIQDFNDSPTSKGIVEQMSKQILISTLLFIIFSLLAALLIVIILQKIINDNRSEFGTLKALGIREKQISNKFLLIPIVTIIMSLIFVSTFTNVVYKLIIEFLNNNYYLPVSKYFNFDYTILFISIFIPMLILVLYTRITTMSLLKQKTLNLLNNIKNVRNKDNGGFISKMSTTVKLQYNTIVYNKDKSLVVFTCSFIITLLISLFTFMYFSATQTYEGVGKELNYNIISVKEKLLKNETGASSNLLSNSFEVDGLKDSKFNDVNQNDHNKKINKSNIVNVNVLGVPTDYSKAYNLTTIGTSNLNKGLFLPAKYKVLYGVKQGDMLSTSYDGKQVFLRVAGFQNNDENVFTYTSNLYLSSVIDKLGMYNSTIQVSSPTLLNKGDLYAIDKNQAVNSIFETQKQILSIIMFVAIIIILIVTPLIFILVANIIDSNIKTIATLKAIGFNLGSIRKLIINPYLPIFVIGELVSIFIVSAFIGRQIIDLFFGYFGFDVIFHASIRTIILIIISIVIVYQFIIILSSQRINIVKTARILNEDSGQVNISSADVKHYFKSSSKSLFDLERPQFRFKWKDVPNLTKKEKKFLIVNVIKKYIPIYLSDLISQSYHIFAAPFILYANNMLIAYSQFTIGVESVFTNIMQLDILNSLTGPLGIYYTQAFSTKNKVAFKDTIRFNNIIKLSTAVFEFLIFMLLGDIIAKFYGVSVAQGQLLYIFAFTIFLKNIVELLNTKFEAYSYMFETKPFFVANLLTNVKNVVSLAFRVLFFKWILQHIVLYIIVEFTFDILLSLTKFILMSIIFRNNKNKDFVKVSVAGMFLIQDWTLVRNIIKDSMPAIQKTIITLPLSLVSSMFVMKLNTVMIQGSAQYVMYTNYLQTIANVAAVIIPSGISGFLLRTITTKLGAKDFTKALQRLKFLRNKLSLLDYGADMIKTASGLILLLFIPLHGLPLQYTLATLISLLVGRVLSWRLPYSQNTIIVGGEFKFHNYYQMITQYFIINISILIVSALGFSQFNQVVKNLLPAIDAFMYSRRLKTGRWLRSTITKMHISNEKEQYDKISIIETNKDGSYKYGDAHTNRNINVVEDFDI